ncbi:MAG: ComEC/Rec2 family competence protein [Rikenellaceae bacterium]
MKNRYTPILYLLLPLIVGVIVASIARWAIYLSILLLVPSLALLYLTQQRWLIYPTIVAFGMLLSSLDRSSTYQAQPLHDSDFAVRIIEGNEAEIFAVRSKMDQRWYAQNIKVIIRGDDSYIAPAHTTAICHGDLTPLERQPNNRYWQMLALKGFVAEIEATEYQEVDPSSLGLREGASKRLNRWALLRLQRLNLSPDAYAAAAAMGLSRRESLSAEVTENYRRSGTAHILALSGLHFGVVLIIISAATYLLPLLNNGHIIADIVAIIAIWLFAFMAGLGESVLRAAWMFSILHLASLTSRSYSSPNSLLSAATLIIIFDPSALFDIGFQLSFIAVLAIIYLGVPLSNIAHSRFGAINFLVKSTIIGCVATIATAPLLAYTFGATSLLSPIATIPLLLTLPIIVATTIIWVIMPLQSLAPLFRNIIEVTTTIQNHIVEWFSYLNIGYCKWNISPLSLVAIYAALLLLTLLIKRIIATDKR